MKKGYSSCHLLFVFSVGLFFTFGKFANSAPSILEKSPMHYLSTICSDGGKPTQEFKWGYLRLTSPNSGEIYFFYGSYDDQYSCEAIADVQFQQRFIHPTSVSCDYGGGHWGFEIDLPELEKVSEKTISISPLLKEYMYQASTRNSLGFCSKNSYLIMRIVPLNSLSFEVR